MNHSVNCAQRKRSIRLYTDIDPFCCEWLKELVKAQALPPGDVLCKSIKDIEPDELKSYLHVHLFCGIGGWPYPAAWRALMPPAMRSSRKSRQRS